MAQRNVIPFPGQSIASASSRDFSDEQIDMMTTADVFRALELRRPEVAHHIDAYLRQLLRQIPDSPAH